MQACWHETRILQWSALQSIEGKIGPLIELADRPVEPMATESKENVNCLSDQLNQKDVSAFYVKSPMEIGIEASPPRPDAATGNVIRD